MEKERKWCSQSQKIVEIRMKFTNSIKIKIVVCILLLIILTLENDACAQHSQRFKIDSLMTVLKSEKNDSIQLATLIQITKEFTTTSSDSAIYYANLANDLSKNMASIENKFNTGVLLSKCYIEKLANDKALEIAIANLKLVANTKHIHLIIQANKNISLIYSEQLNNFHRSLEYAQAAWYAAKQSGSQKDIIECLQLLGSVYFFADKYDEALVFNEQVYQMALLQKDTELIVQSMVSLGDGYRPKKLFKRSIMYYQMAIKILESRNNQTDLPMLYFCLAGVHFEQLNYNESIHYYKLAISRAKKEKWKTIPIHFYRDISRAYSGINNFDEALKYNQIAIDYEKQKGTSPELKDLYLIHLIIYDKQKNYKMAYKNLWQYVKIIDELKNDESANKISALEVALESEKKEKEIERLNKEKQLQKIIRNSFIVGSILLMLLIVVLINRNKLKRVVELEKMRSRLSRDLHDDIGSTLSSINILSRNAQRNAQLLDNTKTKETLEKIHERSQRLLSNMADIIWNIHPENDTLEELMSRMREYATSMLEARNIDSKFRFPTTEIDCKLSMEIKNNLYLIFKEAINNLCKYSEATKVDISLILDSKNLSLMIEDNGKGFITNELKHQGGLNNMKFRAEEMRGSLTIVSELSKGTQIKLIMPRFC